ncbi:hypothetical protein OG21DRAFT_677878 [Imleria badia]|nr:hypothetical protein OG21DRAFT_677878 [Imleria badia]
MSPGTTVSPPGSSGSFGGSRPCADALSLSPSFGASRRTPTTSPSTSASPLSGVMCPFCLTPVSPPGSTCTSAGSRDSACGISGGSARSLGWRASPTLSPVASASCSIFSAALDTRHNLLDLMLAILPSHAFRLVERLCGRVWTMFVVACRIRRVYRRSRWVRWFRGVSGSIWVIARRAPCARAGHWVISVVADRWDAIDIE